MNSSDNSRFCYRAPGHQKYTNKCREKNGLDRMIDWPSQSPDLNLIEWVWGWMECQLGEKWGRIEELETLEVAVKIVWDSVSIDFLESLIASMPDRLQAVIDANGDATRY